MLHSTSKKWRLFRAWAGRNPVWVAWQVTYRCNFHCGFCSYWRDPMGRLPEQTVEQFAEGAGKLAKLGKLPVQYKVGVRYWADSTNNGPEGWGIKFGIVFLFPKK